MDADDLAAFKAATEKLRKRPALIHAADVSFFKDFLSTFTGIRLPLDLSKMDPIDLSDVEDGGAAEGQAPAAAAAKEGTNGKAATGAAGTTQAATALADEDDAVPLLLSPSPVALAPEPVEARTPAPAPGAAPAAGPVAAVDIADSDEEDGERLREETQPAPDLPTGIDLEPEPTPEQLAINAEAKVEAEKAVEAGDLDSAIAMYTEAIMSGGATALIYTKRAELLLRQRRPMAAIRDCAVALEVNPDCGKAYRVRGIASRRLGRWEAAQKDLAHGQKLDFDESIEEVEKFVAEKVRRLVERRAAEAAAPPAATRKRQRRT